VGGWLSGGRFSQQVFVLLSVLVCVDAEACSVRQGVVYARDRAGCSLFVLDV